MSAPPPTLHAPQPTPGDAAQLLRLDVRDARFANLFAPDAPLVRVATGFVFTEGPAWHPVQEHLTFSDIVGNALWRYTPPRDDADAATLSVFRRNSHMANGNTYDRQGRLLTCEHAGSCVSRSDADGTGYEVLATHHDGRALNSPNDIIVHSSGLVLFSDPTSGREPTVGVPRPPELPYAGVYALDPATRALTLLADDFAKPNGLCFDHAEMRLFVNDTIRQHIRVYDVAFDGGGTLSVRGGAVWAALDGPWPGVADGMKVDSAGTLWSCGPGGLHAFAPDATPLGVLLMPEHTTNFAWGGPDLRTLYITASTSLYSVPVAAPGLPLFSRRHTSERG